MAKPGNLRMERGRGRRDGGDREGERDREAAGARVKPGNQLDYSLSSFGGVSFCVVAVGVDESERRQLGRDAAVKTCHGM